MDDIFQEVQIETEDQDSIYETLVGDGKKYSDNEALAKAKREADRFIEQLKQEAAELRQEVAKKATIDEILTQIRQAQPATPSSHPQVPEKKEEVQQTDIEALVSQLLEKKETEKRVKSNAQVVEEKLREKYGADAPVFLNKKAKELNVSIEYLKRVATDSPAAFFKLTDIDRDRSAPPAPSAPRSGYQAPVQSGTRDRQFYEKLKASDRTAYFSPKVQNQLYKDMEAALKAGKEW